MPGLKSPGGWITGTLRLRILEHTRRERRYVNYLKKFIHKSGLDRENGNTEDLRELPLPKTRAAAGEVVMESANTGVYYQEPRPRTKNDAGSAVL